MSGLVFEANTRAPVSAPERADIACFVGFVRRSSAPVSPELQQWLFEQGWSQEPAPWKQPPDELVGLTDVPVPFERWDDFARHFDWEGTYLGAAVHSFFTQGGRKCYVVCLGAPWKPGADRESRATHLEALLPGIGELFEASPHDRNSWHGAAHVLGLPDVSFLCLPDLASALAVDPEPLPSPVPAPVGPEVFVDCSEESPPPTKTLPSPWAAPRCDEAGYKEWSHFLARVKSLLSRHVREVQLVAALPLPYPGTHARTSEPEGIVEDSPYAFLLSEGLLQHFESAFVQLVYPWARTPGSTRLPEELESPEGILLGVLARNALLRGTFRNAMNLGLADVSELFPELGRGTLSHLPAPGPGEKTARPLPERVSLFGRVPGGLRLLSDVTTSPQPSWRQAGVNRLLSALIRAARRVGLDVVFEHSSERTWRELVYRLETVLVRFWDLGALRGRSPREAFEIRCDRTTMTQDDLDAGRLVAEVEFDAAASIERIHVVLTLAEEGVTSLRTEGAP
ncbi:MAG TPA: phage tail sheath protein [Archangium sp.]|nr:phage tail sheath protein [Archangium sp.]